MKFTVNDSLKTGAILVIFAFLVCQVPALLLPEIVSDPFTNQLKVIMSNTLGFFGIMFLILAIVFWKKDVIIRY